MKEKEKESKKEIKRVQRRAARVRQRDVRRLCQLVVNIWDDIYRKGDSGEIFFRLEGGAKGWGGVGGGGSGGWGCVQLGVADDR